MGNHTAEDSDSHHTRYRPVIPIKATTAARGGGGKVASLCTCAGLNLTVSLGRKGEDMVWHWRGGRQAQANRQTSVRH